MTEERPSVIICSYMRDGQFVYLHIPKRIVKDCGITSGQRFLGFIRNSKFVIEQEKVLEIEQEVENAPVMGTR